MACGVGGEISDCVSGDSTSVFKSIYENFLLTPLVGSGDDVRHRHYGDWLLVAGRVVLSG